ncbi:MAG: hypothetical protein AAF799_48210 [Myxococcota bacterium]
MSNSYQAMNEGSPSSPVVASSAVETATTNYERLYATRGEYQRQDTPQTLREGLAEYYRVNPGLVAPETMDDEHSARYFHNHDTTHVIFGTHTGPLDEGVNDLLTMFGVAVSYPRYIKGFFQTKESQLVAKEYGKFSAGVVVRSVLGTLRLIPKIWRTCRAMHRKWPWEPPEGALDRPLAELRAEYGIQVWRGEVVLDFPRDR